MAREKPSWEALLKIAYDRWEDNDKKESKLWNYEDMLHNCSPIEREAVLIGNLDSQVNNGGFELWVDNGYATQLDSLVRILKSIGGKTVQLVIEMIQKLEPFILRNVDNRGFAGGYWVDEDNDQEHTSEGYLDDYKTEGMELADTLDSSYYEISDKFSEEVETYFTGRIAAVIQ